MLVKFRNSLLPVLLITVISLFLLQNIACGEETVKIIFLHTNDMHGRMFPYEDERITPPPEQIGGFQYLSALIKKERSENPGHIILLDGGDIAQGTLYSNMAYGIPMIELMNFVGYDAGVVGNHDFDWGGEKLGGMISSAKFPILGSNVVKKENGNFIPGLKPYILKDIDGIRIGIIGLGCNDTSVYSPESGQSGYSFLSGEEAVKCYIPVLKQIHKADLIVVLSHLGYKGDVELAAKVPGIDLIVGGHSHKPIKTPVVKDKTLIVQAGGYMCYLGKIELDIDKTDKKIVNYKGELITILDNKIEPDEEVSKILDKYREKYKSLGEKIIGETTVELNKSNVKECTLGNLVADVIKVTAQADIGLINTGGIREDHVPIGKISMERIYAVYPFENMLISMDIKGKYIKDTIETCFAGHHAILQVSGLKIKYDLSKPAGQKAVEILVNNEPLDPEKTYKLATADFLAIGGDGYEGLKKGENIQNVMLIRDAIIKYLQEHNPVTSKIEGRLENVGSEK